MEENHQEMEIEGETRLRKVRNQNQRLAEDIRGEISHLKPKLSSSESRLCIFPKKIRDVNPAAYTPQLISVGPLHNGERATRNMETQKLQYLEYFLAKVRPAMSLDELVVYIREEEERIRECYAESIRYSSDGFVKIVLVDSAFIIILFNRTYEKEADDFFGSTLDNSWAEQQDLILFENQLPFFILEAIYERSGFRNFAFKGMEKKPTFRDLTLKYFSNYNKGNKRFPENTKHFADLIRYFQLIQMHNPRDSIIELGIRNEKAESLYSATELQEAGIKFQTSREKFDMHFRKGTLVMPRLTIDLTTECLFRNLIAMEQLLYPQDAEICDYIVLMDYLINTSKDVELLVQKKIILNRLGDHQAVANLFNTLGREIPNVRRNHYYSDLFVKLNEYCEVPCHNWEATLRLEYFKTPFRAASTIAAIILLVLTAIQTVYSVIGK